MYDRQESLSMSKPAGWRIDIEPALTISPTETRVATPTREIDQATLCDNNKAQPFHRRFINHLNSEIECGSSITYPSLYMCFLTGLTSAPSFASCFIWCGFQTGNSAQLGLALARIFTPDHQKTFGFHIMDQQALISLLSFFFGSSLGQFGNKLGIKRRLWLILATSIQILFMIVASLLSHFSNESGLANGRGHPSWISPCGMTALAFLSATMGLQGAVGLRLASPVATTVPLTSTWIDIFNDPFLFAFRSVRTRDIRFAGAISLIFGAFVSRAILGVIGSAATIGIVAGFRSILLMWWFFVPNSKPSEVEGQDQHQQQQTIERKP
ncbi:uncharacterized protein L201_007881 [Kwoniella dendrophila CBS 6074]|uniref:DUF1275 domain protein n=1 Tax=Kwoniella dendrophila CBS 6074 TaxID=1295534 RepID=A0AAX4K6Y3_9TREE